MAIFLTLICIAIITFYIYLKYIYSYWKRRGLSQVEPTLLLGNVKNIVLQKISIGENILELYKKLKVPGRTCAGTYFLVKPELLVLDPELAKTIFTQDFQYFADRGIGYDEENDPLSAHLLALEGNKWKNMRQKLTPTFTSGKMKVMFHTFVECSHGLSDIIDNYAKISEPIDIKEIVGRFTTDIIGSCAFGLECNSLKDPDNEFRKWGKRAFTRSKSEFFHRILSMCFPSFYKSLKVKKVDPGVTNFFLSIVRATVNYREVNNVKRNDFLQLLINVRNSVDDEDKTVPNENKGTSKKLLDEKTLTLEQIAAQSFIFFLAGFETSSTTLTFFFYDLATHQDIQDKVREEINNVLKKHDGKLTYEAVMDMHYLDKVINESMRLHSAIPVIGRVCTKNYQIPNTDIMIEEGTNVNIPIIGYQTDPEYYPNPEKFDPERFSSEEKQKRHPFTFLPFGGGPRNCIGSRFGLLQTKVGIIVLLKNHRYTVNNKTHVPFVMEPKNLIFSVQGGIWLNVEQINKL